MASLLCKSSFQLVRISFRCSFMTCSANCSWCSSFVISPLNSCTSRDVNETLAYETETRPRHLVFGPRRDQDQDLPAIPRDRDVWFLPRDETETLQGRDRDVFRDLQPSALCQNNEWRTCLSWCHKQLSYCNCNCIVHYHEIYSPHKH